MKKIKYALKITAILSVILFLFACNNRLGNDSQSHSAFIVSRIAGKTAAGEEADFYQSDVLKIDADTGLSYVEADTATASLTAKLLEPSPPAAGASYKNNIMLTRYVVSYSLPGGGGTPGVDVPLSFEGSLSILIEVGSTVDVSFIIVREKAKLEEALLLALRAIPGLTPSPLQVNARIDFYGEDLAKKTVQATGYIPVFFGDYVDE